MRNAAVQYDETTGRVHVVVALNSPMADPSQTNALRSTRIELDFGVAYGDDAFSNSCEWGIGGLAVVLNLGSQLASFSNVTYSGTNPQTQPVQVSADRRTLTADYPGNSSTAGLNIICLAGSMTGPDPRTQDFLGDRLLSGFAASDGDIGTQAGASIEGQFTLLYNALAPHKLPAGTLVPGVMDACSPLRGSTSVTCIAQATITSVPGRPRLTIVGRRTFALFTGKDSFGIVGDLVRWRQAMHVQARWARCPHNLHRGGGACTLSFVWKTGNSLVAAFKRADR